MIRIVDFRWNSPLLNIYVKLIFIGTKMTAQKLKTKFLGGLFGTGLGDAIGELAFRRRTKPRLLEGIQQSSELRYTDDTVMAIGLAESLLSTHGRVNPEKVGKTFHSHYKKDPSRGYGQGPPTVFRKVEHQETSYVEAAKELFNGEGSFGNGASMRITPIGLYFFDDQKLYQKAKKSAIPTHTHKLGIDGAASLAKLISMAVKEDKEEQNIKEKQFEILDRLQDFVKTTKFKAKLNTVVTLLRNDVELKVAARRLGAGEKVTALDSVPFVIFAFFHNPYSFRDALLDTVLVSEDRDTIGAMLGGALGSYLGTDAIPSSWIEKLENRNHIEKLATQLFTLKTEM